jgi:putative endonuclease
LKSKGYEILACNWRCRIGEIDIIATDQEWIVFVEVKTRTSTRYGSAVEAVHHQKQQKLKRLAQWYVWEHPAYAMRPMRFDVICVQFLQSRRVPEIQHLEFAFI